MTRGRKKGRERKRDHQRQVEQDRCCRRGGETLQRVENPAVERHQRHQQQIGKRDAGELDRQRKAAGVVREARRQDGNHRRREQQRHCKQHNLACKQDREDAVGKDTCAHRAAVFPYVRIGGDECGVECAFGENGAEMVG